MPDRLDGGFAAQMFAAPREGNRRARQQSLGDALA